MKTMTPGARAKNVKREIGFVDDALFRYMEEAVLCVEGDAAQLRLLVKLMKNGKLDRYEMLSQAFGILFRIGKDSGFQLQIAIRRLGCIPDIIEQGGTFADVVLDDLPADTKKKLKAPPQATCVHKPGKRDKDGKMTCKRCRLVLWDNEKKKTK